MPSPKRERKILIDLDAQPMPLPDVVVSDRPELIVDLGNLRPPSEIKVMAIGQGGIKAAQVLIEKGYTHADYVACDTDVALLAETSIPVRLQLGNSGIGTGNNPSLARDEAVASTDKIIRALAGDTKILFLLAGLGGGVGTGCTPVIARIAHSLGIITVAVVTTPFLFEGNEPIDRALDGIQVLANEVDSLLVINNEKLLLSHPELTLLTAFSKSDLAQAEPVASLSSLNNHENFIIPVDFRILCDFLSHGGVSFHSVGYARGPGRVTRAIEDALRSPLVADYDINQAKSVLVHIQCGSQGDDGDDENMLTLDEYTELDRFFDSFFNSSFNEINYFRGLAIDDTLGEYVCISLFAGGFALENISGMRTHLDAAADAREQQRAREEELCASTFAEFFFSGALLFACVGSGVKMCAHTADVFERETAGKEEELRERRRAEFYGLNETSPLPRRQHAVYIFQPDDLDNPEVIRMVEASPTGRRTTELHAQIVRQSLTPPPTATSDSEQTQPHV